MFLSSFRFETFVPLIEHEREGGRERGRDQREKTGKRWKTERGCSEEQKGGKEAGRQKAIRSLDCLVGE